MTRLYALPRWAVHLGKTEQGHDAREATPADLLAHLARSPATALQIAEQLRVARPWWIAPEGSRFRFDGRCELADEAAASADYVTAVGHVWFADGAWHGAVYTSSLDDTWIAAHEAMAAVDQVLADLGTILVSR